MGIYAVLRGYTDAENMAFFMKLQEPYFEKMLDLKYGVPSANILFRVFALCCRLTFLMQKIILKV